MGEKKSKKEKETDKLISQYKKDIENDPENRWKYYRDLYNKKGPHTKAEEKTLKKAFGISVNLMLAGISIEDKDFLLAIQMLQKVISTGSGIEM